MGANPPESASSIPSFEEIATAIDRLRELAAEHLQDPQMVRVEGWDNGRFDASAHHNTGLVDGPGSEYGGQRIRYDLDREMFVLEWVRWRLDEDKRAIEQEDLESFSCPVEVPPPPSEDSH